MDAQLDWARLDGAEIKEPDFRGASAVDTDFEGARLANSDFRCSNVYGANFRDAEITDSSFAYANVDRAEFRGAGGVTKSDFSGSTGSAYSINCKKQECCACSTPPLNSKGTYRCDNGKRAG